MLFYFNFSLLVKCLNMVLQSRFAIMKEYHLSKRLFELYLSQNYSWFLKITPRR